MYDDDRSRPEWRLAPEDEHAHYRRFREEHARRLDEEYRQWCRQRFSGDFEAFRRSRPADPLAQREPLAPRREGALHSLGRAVSETVTGSRTPDLDERARAQPYANDDEVPAEERTERFFERS
jgi:hypothetical protein